MPENKPRTLSQICIKEGKFWKEFNGNKYCSLSSNGREIECSYIGKRKNIVCGLKKCYIPLISSN